LINRLWQAMQLAGFFCNNYLPEVNSLTAGLFRNFDNVLISILGDELFFPFNYNQFLSLMYLVL